MLPELGNNSRSAFLNHNCFKKKKLFYVTLVVEEKRYFYPFPQIPGHIRKGISDLSKNI